MRNVWANDVARIRTSAPIDGKSLPTLVSSGWLVASLPVSGGDAGVGTPTAAAP